MTRYAILLRGVNVGGIIVKSAPLKDALVSLGLEDVQTLLASGNVVCTSRWSAKRLKQEVEARLEEVFGYDAWVIILTGERLAELVAQVPFRADDPGLHGYVTLTSDPTALDALEAEAVAAGAGVVRVGPEALAWSVEKGTTLASPMGKVSAKARYRQTTTTRNLRTLLKIVAAAGEGDTQGLRRPRAALPVVAPGPTRTATHPVPKRRAATRPRSGSPKGEA